MRAGTGSLPSIGWPNTTAIDSPSWEWHQIGTLGDCASGPAVRGALLLGEAVPSRPSQHRPVGCAPPPLKQTHPHYSTSAWQRLREQIKQRGGYRCVRRRAKDGRLCADHIVERTKGGCARCALTAMN